MATKYPEYTVTSLTARIKGALESGFSNIVVEGEISGWRRYPSGHCYFTLKDEGAQISCVMFSGSYEASCGRHPELRDGLVDGAKAKLFGSVSAYAARGNYQLVVRAASLAGLGGLMQKYLELKSKLEREGLFDQSRKRPLPAMPRRIGIVTSEAGAVIHDMCNVLTRRFPNLEIRLFPALVQGAEAPKTIVAGIEYFNGAASDFRADLLIVARGGGSFEDLFCFNDETLVRAVAASEIPTISAVGHETDYTLCDFAADRRAGTPSIAAEMAVPVMSELKSTLAAHLSRLPPPPLRSAYEYNAQRVDHLSSALAPALESRSVACSHRVETLSAALESSVALVFAKREAAFSQLRAKLDLLSPYSVLKRGYSLTTDASGAVVKSAASVRSGDILRTRLSEGEVESVAR